MGRFVPRSPTGYLSFIYIGESVTMDFLTDREVSWLSFNERVLEMAEDETLPLLERVRFLAIFSSNLDEFFMVRVESLHRKL